VIDPCGQPFECTLNKDIADAVKDWYEFAKSAYSATEEEFFRDEEEGLEMPATTDPITDECILRRARTVKVGKATGERDDINIHLGFTSFTNDDNGSADYTR
jgi:hypothetical protein